MKEERWLKGQNLKLRPDNQMPQRIIPMPWVLIGSANLYLDEFQNCYTVTPICLPFFPFEYSIYIGCPMHISPFYVGYTGGTTCEEAQWCSNRMSLMEPWEEVSIFACGRDKNLSRAGGILCYLQSEEREWVVCLASKVASNDSLE